MDGKEKKEYPSLPPNYVSLAQLQERWLLKQEEEKLKKKQEEDKLKQEEEKKKREAETQNKNRDRRALTNDGVSAGPPRDDAPPGKDGREIQVKGKGKEAAIGDSENGDGKKWKKKKNKNKNKKHYEKKISAADEVSIANEMENEKPKSEIIEECNGGSKVIEEIVNVSVLNVKGLDIGRGFRRNEGNNSGYKSKTEYRVRVNEKKETEVKLVMEEKIDGGEKGHFRKWSGRRRNGGYGPIYRTPNESKGNEVKQELEKKAEDEICSEICGGLSGIKNGGNKIEEDNRVEERELSADNRVVLMEKKVDEEVLVVESGKNGENGRNVYNRRNGNWRENINREFGGKVRSMVDGRRYGRNGNGWKTESGNMMWVKKQEKAGAEDGSSGISGDQ